MGSKIRELISRDLFDDAEHLIKEIDGSNNLLAELMRVEILQKKNEHQNAFERCEKLIIQLSNEVDVDGSTSKKTYLLFTSILKFVSLRQIGDRDQIDELMTYIVVEHCCEHL